MHIAHLEERLDVRLVRMRGEGIAEEDHRVDVAGHDALADLQIAAHRSAVDAFNLQIEFLGQPRLGRSLSRRQPR